MTVIGARLRSLSVLGTTGQLNVSGAVNQRAYLTAVCSSIPSGKVTFAKLTGGRSASSPTALIDGAPRWLDWLLPGLQNPR